MNITIILAIAFSLSYLLQRLEITFVSDSANKGIFIYIRDADQRN